MDSYDKLKPYGIAINGCIDGFSRHIMWMEAYTTNSNPKVIAEYFINTVTCIGGCPKQLRADPGTENVRDIQTFLGKKSHGPSIRRRKLYLQMQHSQSADRDVVGGPV